MKKINRFIKNRYKIAQNYIEFINKKILKNLISIPNYKKPNLSSWHLFIISIDFLKLKINKNDLLNFLLKNNILCQVHYTPIYKYKLFNKRLSYINCEKYFKNCLSLPIYPNLRKSDQKYIMKKIYFFW